MMRAFIVTASVLTVLLGLAPAANAANPPFCKGVKPCVIGGDAGVTWVNAAASSAAQGRKIAARLLRNAQAVHREYGAPEYIDIRVVKKGACWRKYGGGTAKPRRSCVQAHVERRLS
ncbi:hypothetical protein [Nonomuraea sp. NPDC050643]|uniref:hypothetical protein n=1 Tax=Nonomuraea sp. NPDC050643 TaxID=3155660 RepID=UPI0033EB311D